jgi:hypothetical protein
MGFGGLRGQSLHGDDAKKYLWVARIVSVDIETMVCNIRYGTGTGDHADVPIPAASGSGPRCWAGMMPEPGAVVVIGWYQYGQRLHKPYILQYLTSGVFPAREYEPFSSADPAMAKAAFDALPELDDDPGIFLRPTRLKLRKAYPGDYLVTTSGGSDFIMDRDVYFSNRSGVEFRLRDADQTAVLQTINSFESNAAGYFRRGLIRRDAFNLLPDLGFDEETNSFTRETNPDAFDKLVEFGLLKDDGTTNFPEDADTLYPYDVTPDGIRVSFVHHGEFQNQFSGPNTPLDCYVEDRVELRHTSTGIMEVTEEGDGFQMEKFLPFIEEVRGTVVGNDPFTDVGRSLYKRILSMSLFDQPDIAWNPGIKPKFFSVDQITRANKDADTKALAKLLRIRCTENNNQFVFGITKEGRVFVHVPSSTGNTPDEKGKSIDLFTAGKIRAAIGIDPQDSRSADLSFAGGIRLDIGRDSNGNSIDVRYAGPVKQTFDGNNQQGFAYQATIGGSKYEAVSAEKFVSVQGGSTEIVGGDKTLEVERLTINAGTGGKAFKSAGPVSETILNKKDYKIALLQTEIYALGRTGLSLAGTNSDTMLAGVMSRTVTAGSMNDTVATGNFSQTVGAGNMSVSVGTGNLSVAVGAGNLSLVTAAGSATLGSTVITNVTSSGVVQILAPVTKIGAVPIGGAVCGLPGPPIIDTDPVTGLPARGFGTILLGV